MNTPIVDFVRRFSAGDTVRFHMPGHKGKPYLGYEAWDITEIKGADVLSQAEGIIAKSEENATALFGTAHTFYATEGATLAIGAMLRLALLGAREGKVPTVLAGRNAHKAFLYAAGLLGIDVKWLYPVEDSHLCACPLTPTEVEKALSLCVEKPLAVYLTSPDYLGNVLDIAGISAVCKAAGVPLLVDNAHGAYLKFLNPSQHPIDLGATLCADSAHKTLPVLTGGAYLHVAKDAPEEYLKGARAALALFASTSPSYLVLQSLDMANAYLSEQKGEPIRACARRVAAFKEELAAHGFVFFGEEPLKLTVDSATLGWEGTELAEYLREHGIEAEFADRRFLVLMVSPANTEGELGRLKKALLSLPKRPVLRPIPMRLPRPLVATTVREALLLPAEEIPVREALGRVCATPVVSCPPAIPLVVSGEVIDEAAVTALLTLGEETVFVLKK